MKLRFEVGTAVMCDVGDSWKLGIVDALNYREKHWPPQKSAPYQVLVYEGEAGEYGKDNEGPLLIYVPEDEDDYCRKATAEDLRIAQRNWKGNRDRKPDMPGDPQNWLAADLYSDHYSSAQRQGHEVNRECFDLGIVRVGDHITHKASSSASDGFLQCPMLARLPPGVRFLDDGSLSGPVHYDPHRGSSYKVEFIAVSTSKWDNPLVGIVQLEIKFAVIGNLPRPGSIERDRFNSEQENARERATRMLENLGQFWQDWEQERLNHRDACTRMHKESARLRDLLEQYPRLDNGMYWAHLGGSYMNLHKLLENTLFESELYFGHALTYDDQNVRRCAEEGLNECYNKRLREAARYTWMHGAKQILEGKYAEAAETLRLAADKKDGSFWGTNNGDIYITEAAARLLHGADLVIGASSRQAGRNNDREGALWVSEAEQLLEQSAIKAAKCDSFGSEPHPWFTDLQGELRSFRSLRPSRGAGLADWFRAFRARSIFRCAQILAGQAPFPPKPRPRRLEDTATLVQRLPGKIAESY